MHALVYNGQMEKHATMLRTSHPDIFTLDPEKFFGVEQTLKALCAWLTVMCIWVLGGYLAVNVC
jgi:hypothetical protein